MDLLPTTRRYVAKFFNRTKNVADAIDKMATVGGAFGLGDPSGHALTVGAAVSLAAKSVSAIAAIGAEIAAAEGSAAASEDYRTALVVYAANLAYFTALDEVLSPHVADLEQVAIPKREACALDALVSRDRAFQLLAGKCSLFTVYEEQLLGALRGAGKVWSERESLARQVTERAEALFRLHLAGEEKAFVTLQKLLQNECSAETGKQMAAMPSTLEGAVQRAFSDSGGFIPQPPVVARPVAAPGPSEVASLSNQIDRLAGLLAGVEISPAGEVGILLKGAKSRFDRAKVMLDSGGHSKAAVLFEDVAKELEGFDTDEARSLRARAIANRGHALVRLGDHAEAARLFRTAHALAPSTPRIIVTLGLAELLEGHAEKAEKVLRGVFHDRPDEPDVVELLAETMERQGNLSGALELLQRHPRASEQYFITYATLLLKLGRLEEAETNAREAGKRWPQSRHSQFCIGFVIAEPILTKLEKGGVLTSAIRARLTEAASHMEKAVAAASQAPAADRALYLGNLCAIWAPIGEHDHAVKAGTEAHTLCPNDVLAAHNLYLSQMLAGRYLDAAKTAQELRAIVPGHDSACREMQALMAAGEFARALTAYEEAQKVTPEIDEDPQLIAFRAECLRRRPDLEASEQLVAVAIERFGRLPVLLVQQATMAEFRGQQGTAEALYLEAERLSSGKEQRLVRRRFGLFLYDQHRWTDALTRLVEPEEDPLLHPAFVQYLHCLYQLKRMPDVARLGKEYVGNQSFDPGVWGMTAKALAELGRIKEAAKVMGEVAQHIPSERSYLEHAHLQARAFGLPAAIKVLEAAQVQEPKSFLVAVNLSGMYFSTRQYRRAFEQAKKAIEIEPEREEGHTAMVRVLGADAKALALTDEEKELLQKSLARSKAVTRFEMAVDRETVDLSNLLAMLKDRHVRMEQVMDLYRKNRLPLCMLAKGIGRDFAETWSLITGSSTERFYIAAGTQEEQDGDREAARSATRVSVDYSALLTLQALGLLRIFGKAYDRVLVATATREQVVAELTIAQSFAPGDASIRYENGGIGFTEIPAEYHAKKVRALTAIVEFINSDPVSVEGLSDEGWNEWQTRRSPEVVPDWAYHPILVAKAHNVPLYSDEQGVRSIAKLNHSVSGFCSQGFIRACSERGLLNAEEADTATIGLVDLNGDFVSLSGREMMRFVTDTRFARSAKLNKLFRQLAATNYSDELSPQILGSILALSWFELPQPDRDEWAGLCLDSLNAAAGGRLPALMRVVRGAGSQLVFFPEVLCALLHFMAASPKLKPEERRFLRDSMAGMIEAFAVMVEARFGENPRLVQQWERFGREFSARKRLLR